MYAIIKTGGKQYRVAEGDIIDVELLHSDEGKAVEFKDVLFFFDGNTIKIGKEITSDYLVKAEVIKSSVAGPKIVSVKYRPSHHERRKFGHRQKKTRVKITSLVSKEKKKETKHGS